MAFSSTLLPAILATTLIVAPVPGEKKAPEDLAQMKVRLRLNAIETAHLLEHYDTLFKRELGLHDAVRACMKSGDARLPEYQQALQNAQHDLETTKKRLIMLESERAKLIDNLGGDNASTVPSQLHEELNRTTKGILECLTNIEKLMEKMERRR